MSRFELILDCRSTDIKAVTDYVRKEIVGNFVIVTDSKSLKDQFSGNGIHAETILENIPTNSDEEQRIYQTIWENMISLRTNFSDITDNGVEIFLGFRHQIHDDLIMLEKLYSILVSKRKIHTIFCLTTSSSYYYACIGLASSLGYRVSWPLKIKNNKIIPMNPLSNTRQLYIYEILYHNRLPSIKKIIAYLWDRANQFLSSRKYLASQQIKFIKAKKSSPSYNNIRDETRIISSALKLQNAIISELNAVRHANMNNDKSRPKLIDKLSSFQFKDKPCLFYLSTNDIDLYLKPVYPIIEQFEKNHHPYVILAHNQHAKEALSGKKIEYLNYQSYLLDFGYDFEIVKKMIQTIKKISIQNNSMISIYFQFFMDDTFFFELINKLRSIRFFSLLISELNPISIFVMPDSIGEQLIMCDIGKKHNIKTVTTFAALIAPTPRSVGFMGSEIITTYGVDCDTSLLKMGYSKDRLVMTGSPRYDDLNKLDISKLQTKLTTKFNVDFSKPILLIATSGQDNNEVNWITDIVRYANKNNYEIIVKFHPSFEMERSRSLYEKNKGLKFYFLKYNDIEISELIPISNVIITDNSSVGTFGVLANKPMIVANLRKVPYPDNRYDEYGVALLATSIKELESCIDRVLTDKPTLERLEESRKKYQYWYNYKNDGMAAVRIFEILTSH